MFSSSSGDAPLLEGEANAALAQDAEDSSSPFALVSEARLPPGRDFSALPASASAVCVLRWLPWEGVQLRTLPVT